MPKEEFVAALSRYVEPGNPDSLFNPFEAFSSGADYKGYFTADGFSLRRKQRLVDMYRCLATARGTFRPDGESLTIEAEIDGLSKYMVFFYAFLSVFYLLFLTVFGFAAYYQPEMLFGLFFILIHALFMMGIPYLVMRSSAKSLAYDLEREFFYMTKDHKPA